MPGKAKDDPTKTQQQEIADKKRAFLSYFRAWPVKKAAGKAERTDADIKQTEKLIPMVVDDGDGAPYLWDFVRPENVRLPEGQAMTSLPSTLDDPDLTTPTAGVKDDAFFTKLGRGGTNAHSSITDKRHKKKRRRR